MNVDIFEETGEMEMAISIAEIIRKARNELNKLTGLDLSSTLKTLKDENGWRVWVELVEQHVVPNNMDVLATYEAVLDNHGNFLEFSRKGMRRRADTLAEE